MISSFVCAFMMLLIASCIVLPLLAVLVEWAWRR